MFLNRSRRQTWHLIKIRSKELTIKYVKKLSALPWIFRIVLAVLLCLGGVLGFLPILGFWMLPLGLLGIGLCLPFTDQMIADWVRRLEAELTVDQKSRRLY
ncbi:MAG: hypothetical protein OXC80_01630 [Gammaproteobacteria bacterium]|nr:hypothetical protein [Gammaproteobacteria bacterium]